MWPRWSTPLAEKVCGRHGCDPSNHRLVKRMDELDGGGRCNQNRYSEIVDSSDSDRRTSRLPDRGVSNNRSVRFMKPDKFTGASSVETFLIQFGVCADYNRWNKIDMAAQLKCCLAGATSQILWDGGTRGDMSYDELVTKLKARFGSDGMCELYA